MSVSNPTSSPVMSATWDFGDPASESNTATGVTVTHTFSLPGTYLVRVTATDDQGAVGSTVTPVTVGHAIVPAISVDPAPVVTRQTVLFSGAGSVDQTGDITSYLRCRPSTPSPSIV